MKISQFKMDFEESKVEVWMTLYHRQDVDDLIAWLKMVKEIYVKWDKLNPKLKK